MSDKRLWIIAFAIIICMGLAWNLSELLGVDWLVFWVLGIWIIGSLIYNVIRYGSWKGPRDDSS